jgi:hypothetical protein
MWRLERAIFGVMATSTVAIATVGFLWQPAKAAVPDEVSYSRDIAPILQRSCESCHRTGGVAPMPLSSYEQVRPWARAIKQRTGVGPHAGVMPPWYMEKNIGIQRYKNDPSLSDEEVALIAKWVDIGAPQGNPADMPPPRTYDNGQGWTIGTPDLIVKTRDIVVKANSPDWWGSLPPVPIPLDEDRYVVAVQVKEVNNVDAKSNSERTTVGGRFVVHHMIWQTRVVSGGAAGLPEDDDPSSDAFLQNGTVKGDAEVTPWPTHEVGRNADAFDITSAQLLRAHSTFFALSAHLHSNGSDTTAHLEIAFKFAPKGFVPEYQRAFTFVGNNVDIDVKAMETGQQLHAYAVLPDNAKIMSFEPHLHAAGMRMCLEAIWGHTIQTLTCAGYDHNWVPVYPYADDYQPLLPKGTILHAIGYMDNSPSNKNEPDPRNWQGSGNRTVGANMFVAMVYRLPLTDEQFRREMAERREKRELTGNNIDIGCPLCTVTFPQFPSAR